MSERKKAGCGSILLGCAGFCVLGLVLSYLALNAINQNTIEDQQEAQRVEKELPKGTADRLQYELDNAISYPLEVTTEGNALTIDVSISANEAFGVTEGEVKRVFTKALTAVEKAGFTRSDSITITADYPLTDKFGNKIQTIVASITLEKSTLDQINWSRIQALDPYEIADNQYAHPVFDGQ